MTNVERVRRLSGDRRANVVGVGEERANRMGCHFRAWSAAVVFFALVGVLAGCVSGSAPLGKPSGPVISTQPATSTPTPTPTSVPQNCSAAQMLLTAEWEPGAVAYGTDPAHRRFGGDLIGRITAVNQGPTCVMSGRPLIGIVSSTGVVLNVRSVADRGCRLSCNAPAHLFLRVGAVSVAGMQWEPSYCGADPGSDVRLRVTLPGGTVTTIAVRNLGGAGKPIHAPSCTPALAETRLFVERFAGQQ